MSHTPLTDEIERWLLAEALHDADIVELFGALCVRLHGLGIPLSRAALSWPTLHPLFQAEQIYWRLGRGAELFQYRHATELTATFESSPFHHVLVNGLPSLRRRLEGPETLKDFPVLEELSEQGYTDYLLTATSFRIADVGEYRGGASGIMASWATARPGGFSDADLTALTRVQTTFAVACHASIQKRVMSNLAAAYLGETGARRVLSGEVRRGDGDRIRAVLWYSDLRGSTRLSNALAPEAYLQLLRDYYDCTAQPVIDEGGEILEFIGDAVLAIFPIRGDTGGPEAARAALRALEAARARRRICLSEKGAPAGCTPDQLRFSIAVATGEMMFGNIGVPTRLTFSAIGADVNRVARLEELAKTLGRSALVTKEIAALEPGRWTPLGPHGLRDFEDPVEVCGLAEEQAAVAPGGGPEAAAAS